MSALASTTQHTTSLSPFPLKGRIVLITGCTGGIGKATARALALKGASIAVHFHSAVETADSLVKELKSYGVDAAPFKVNFSSTLHDLTGFLTVVE